MRVQFLHAVVRPYFVVYGDDDRPIDTLTLDEAWVRYYGGLASLPADVERWAAEKAAEYAQAEPAEVR